ncbi:winged helix-turn-helix domain-containing protein [Pseudonocardia sp. CA-107938]|uniref:winged helix-turn-helix domain-containing protein n=1 Tax=Pseudonocardia sp. CA-107938 TaxID=3240021 RepID=UPI003D946F8F
MTASAAAESRIHVDPRSAVRVTFDPYTSVLALACASARDLTRGHDTPLARIATRMPDRGLRAVARLVTPGSSVGPDCLTPANLGEDTDVAVQIDRLRALTADELTADFARNFGARAPQHWRQVVDDPRPWASDVADALSALWTLVEPVWRRESALRGREADRVGAAAARQSLDIVLAGAHPRGRVCDGALVFPDPEATVTDATGRTVVLAPVLQRLDVSISNLEQPDILWFAYPVPGSTGPAADPAGLDALLTPVRALVLRALSDGWSMSQIATTAGIGASAATYHVDALVAAGLVVRRREGRRTLVSRTPRGDGLIDLYEHR